MESINKTILRELPKVDDILKHIEINELILKYPRSLVVEGVRNSIDWVRKQILNGNYQGSSQQLGELVISQALDNVKNSVRPNVRRVINGTGVVLHTNLGRALLSENARKSVERVAASYCNLEINLETGKRGSRYEPVEDLLIRLTGAEAALVVNNNASAVLLALGALAKGKEVIVSRGQLVEIGGSFRIPEVMEQSGAKLVEVGATNKTHPRDYQTAITEETALLMHVHTSNYRIVGFTKETSMEELAEIGRQANIPVMSDLGSGFLVDLSKYGLPKEPSVQETVSAGADVVTFSGDKLLGGPQAGIIVGKRKYIDKMKKFPLTRAVRIDKFTVAALEATLREYLDENSAMEHIPTLQMLTMPKELLLTRAEELAKKIRDQLMVQAKVTVTAGSSQVGGGSMPTAELPTFLVSCLPVNQSVDGLAAKLRGSDPAVVARVQEGCLLLDLRTIQPGEVDELAGIISNVLNTGEVQQL